MAKLFDRFLLFIFSLAICVISVTTLLASLSVINELDSLNFIRDVFEQSSLNNIVIVVAFVLFLLGLRFLYLSVRVQNPRNRSYQLSTPMGEIMISMETIENLSLKAANAVRGVKDLKPRVKISEQGLEISIRVVVDGVHAIPELTEQIQQHVTKDVTEITGIQVNNVSVFVANIIQNPNVKRRVE